MEIVPKTPEKVVIIDKPEKELSPSTTPAERHLSTASTFSNPAPQAAPGSTAAVGHTCENSIPLSIFPIAHEKFVVCFSGLPGRGKTHVSRRLARYLSFFHAVPVELYNAGEYRRNMFSGIKEASWFDVNNEEAMESRRLCNIKVMEDMTEFLNKHSNGIAILDSTNPTHKRRQVLVEKMASTGAKVFFVEVQNDDETFIMNQMRDVVGSSPDYKGMDPEVAFQDYRKRLSIFERTFEPLGSDPTESKWCYMQCNHHTQHFVVHKVRGYLPLKIVHFIMNLRTTKHAFYLSRHGQSEYNEVGRIGGDSGLTYHGEQYGKELAKFVKTQMLIDENGKELPGRLWTSSMLRTRQTAAFIEQNTILVPDENDPSLLLEWIQMKPRRWHHLDEIFAGVCDGMTYEEIEATFPDEFERRKTDKLAYRYPRGESYLDVIARLEPMVLEMERHREPLLIVAHQGILRILYAFYMGLSRSESPYVSIPLNTIVQLVPSAFSCSEARYKVYSPPKDLPSDGQQEPQGPTAGARANVGELLKDLGVDGDLVTAVPNKLSRPMTSKYSIENDSDDPPSH